MPKKTVKKVATPKAKSAKKSTGAGRPKGSGKYGSETKAMRVPAHLVEDIQAFIFKKIKDEKKAVK
ncbi:MAG: hypothetical protein ACRC2T_05105 [Thermoguttaceae bacterium]